MEFCEQPKCIEDDCTVRFCNSNAQIEKSTKLKFLKTPEANSKLFWSKGTTTSPVLNSSIEQKPDNSHLATTVITVLQFINVILMVLMRHYVSASSIFSSMFIAQRMSKGQSDSSQLDQSVAYNDVVGKILLWCKDKIILVSDKASWYQTSYFCLYLLKLFDLCYTTVKKIFGCYCSAVSSDHGISDDAGSWIDNVFIIEKLFKVAAIVSRWFCWSMVTLCSLWCLSVLGTLSEGDTDCTSLSTTHYSPNATTRKYVNVVDDVNACIKGSLLMIASLILIKFTCRAYRFCAVVSNSDDMFGGVMEMFKDFMYITLIFIMEFIQWLYLNILYYGLLVLSVEYYTLHRCQRFAPKQWLLNLCTKIRLPCKEFGNVSYIMWIVIIVLFLYCATSATGGIGHTRTVTCNLTCDTHQTVSLCDALNTRSGQDAFVWILLAATLSYYLFSSKLAPQYLTWANMSSISVILVSTARGCSKNVFFMFSQFCLYLLQRFTLCWNHVYQSTWSLDCVVTLLRTCAVNVCHKCYYSTCCGLHHLLVSNRAQNINCLAHSCSGDYPYVKKRHKEISEVLFGDDELVTCDEETVSDHNYWITAHNQLKCAPVDVTSQRHHEQHNLLSAIGYTCLHNRHCTSIDPLSDSDYDGTCEHEAVPCEEVVDRTSEDQATYRIADHSFAQDERRLNANDILSPFFSDNHPAANIIVSHINELLDNPAVYQRNTRDHHHQSNNVVTETCSLEVNSEHEVTPYQEESGDDHQSCVDVKRFARFNSISLVYDLDDDSDDEDEASSQIDPQGYKRSGISSMVVAAGWSHHHYLYSDVVRPVGNNMNPPQTANNLPPAFECHLSRLDANPSTQHNVASVVTNVASAGTNIATNVTSVVDVVPDGPGIIPEGLTIIPKGNASEFLQGQPGKLPGAYPHHDIPYETKFDEDVPLSLDEVRPKLNGKVFLQPEVENRSQPPSKLPPQSANSNAPQLTNQNTASDVTGRIVKSLPKRSCIVVGSTQYPLAANLLAQPHMDHFFLKERNEIKPGHFLAKLVLRHNYLIRQDDNVAGNETITAAQQSQAAAVTADSAAVDKDGAVTERQHFPLNVNRTGYIVFSSDLTRFTGNMKYPLPGKRAAAVKIGKGGNGFVFSIFHGGKEYAVKKTVYRQNEVRVHSQLAHVNLINLDAVLIGEEHERHKGKFYAFCFMTKLDMDLRSVVSTKEHGCLKHLKLQLSEQRSVWELVMVNIKYVLRSVLKALDYMHNQGLVHRDVKASNILLKMNCQCTKPLMCSCPHKCSVKLGDFDSSTTVPGYGLRIEPHQMIRYASVLPLGTMGYRAPEVSMHLVISGPYEVLYTTAVDIWSFGCLLLNMLIGKSGPLKQRGEASLLLSARDVSYAEELYNKIIKVKELQKYYSDVPGLVDLVRKCLQVDLHCRPTAKQLLQLDVLQC